MKKLFIVLMMSGVLVSVDAFAQITASTTSAALYTKCPAGMYAEEFTGKDERGGKCLPCTGNTYSSSPGSKKCQPCPSGQKPNEDHTKCEIGTVRLEDGSMLAATSEVTIASRTNNNKDLYCKDGYYKKTKGAKTCTKCPAGYKCNNNKRTKCPAGQYSAAGSGKCLACQAGTYSKAGSGKCTKCPAGTLSGSNASECKKCSAGTYSSHGVGCITCPDGTYSAAGAKSCKACPKGKMANKNHTACVKA